MLRAAYCMQLAHCVLRTMCCVLCVSSNILRSTSWTCRDSMTSSEPFTPGGRRAQWRIVAEGGTHRRARCRDVRERARNGSAPATNRRAWDRRSPLDRNSPRHRRNRCGEYLGSMRAESGCPLGANPGSIQGRLEVNLRSTLGVSARGRSGVDSRSTWGRLPGRLGVELAPS